MLSATAEKTTAEHEQNSYLKTSENGSLSFQKRIHHHHQPSYEAKEVEAEEVISDDENNNNNIDNSDNSVALGANALNNNTSHDVILQQQEENRKNNSNDDYNNNSNTDISAIALTELQTADVHNFSYSPYNNHHGHHTYYPHSTNDQHNLMVVAGTDTEANNTATAARNSFHHHHALSQPYHHPYFGNEVFYLTSHKSLVPPHSSTQEPPVFIEYYSTATNMPIPPPSPSAMHHHQSQHHQIPHHHPISITTSTIGGTAVPIPQYHYPAVAQHNAFNPLFAPPSVSSKAVNSRPQTGQSNNSTSSSTGYYYTESSLPTHLRKNSSIIKMLNFPTTQDFPIDYKRRLPPKEIDPTNKVEVKKQINRIAAAKARAKKKAIVSNKESKYTWLLQQNSHLQQKKALLDSVVHALRTALNIEPTNISIQSQNHNDHSSLNHHQKQNHHQNPAEDENSLATPNISSLPLQDKEQIALDGLDIVAAAAVLSNASETHHSTYHHHDYYQTTHNTESNTSAPSILYVTTNEHGHQVVSSRN